MKVSSSDEVGYSVLGTPAYIRVVREEDFIPKEQVTLPNWRCENGTHIWKDAGDHDGKIPFVHTQNAETPVPVNAQATPTSSRPSTIGSHFIPLPHSSHSAPLTPSSLIFPRESTVM